MARVGYVARGDMAPATREAFDALVGGYGPFDHLGAALAHRPPILENYVRMLLGLRAEGRLARRHLELILVAVSQLSRCEYCIAHHAPMLGVEGISAAGIERLLDHADHPELDAVDRLVVEYTILVVREPGRIRDAIFARLRAHFDEAQIVEMTWRIGMCQAANMFNQALQLDVEPAAEAAMKALAAAVPA